MNFKNKLSEEDLAVIEASKSLKDGRWNSPFYSSVLNLFSRLGAMAIILFSSLTRTKTFGLHRCFEALADNRPVLFVCWHGSFMLPIYHFRKRNIVIMTSLSKDGDTLTRILYLMGFKCVRGSSSRGGIRGLLQMVKMLNADGRINAAITVDGPQGPRKEVKPGAVLLAKKTNALLVPLGLGYNKVWRLNNWDKSEVPIPASKSVLIAGKPFKIPQDLSIKSACALIKEKITLCEVRAQNYLKTGIMETE